MDNAELEESLFAISDAKLHGGMCKILSNIYCKVLNIFPAIEAARPRSRSGIQTLCSLHIALENAKNLLQHCSECSKLYLAITGESVVLKFEKAKCSLVDSLKRVDDIVPQAIGSQVEEIVTELERTAFSLDRSEKQVGDDIIALLQRGRNFDDTLSDNNELDTFHQAASKLSITSSRAALAERRALKKLIEKARMEEDKRKESVVAYLLHLIRKYSKLFRSDLGDDQDSQGSGPCSPTIQGSSDDGKSLDRRFTKINSFNFKPSLALKQNTKRSEQVPYPPEELRCPISLQLMYDPVIIASGQTYERICIEKWFNDGHNTCPKTQQHLPHLCLTPNYCVKGLIASWCEQNGINTPDGPPESLDFNYWRLALSDNESTQSQSLDSSTSGKLNETKKVEKGESDQGNEVESGCVDAEENGGHIIEKYEKFLGVLEGGEELMKKKQVVGQIRRILKDDEEARMFMGSHGFVEALVCFLESALIEKIDSAVEAGTMALFNLAVNNNRNKEMMLATGIIPLLTDLMNKAKYYGLAAALYLNLSCLEDAKPVIGSSKAVPFLIELLLNKVDLQSKLDALHALFNLSTHQPNIPHLLQSGIVNGLQLLLLDPIDQTWTEKSIAVIINLASNMKAKEIIIAAPGLVGSLAGILDSGEIIEQEQSVSCLLLLCTGNDKCIQMVLQEGVIPSLVSLQVNGTTRARDKSQKLLTLFREQRQRDSSPQKMMSSSPSTREEKPPQQAEPNSLTKSASVRTSPTLESKPLGKIVSRKKFGMNFSFFRKSKHLSGKQP